MVSPARNNSEKSVIDYLTEKPQASNLENVPGDTNTRHDTKTTFGGKADMTQPPLWSGFFMPASLHGDNTSLPGVHVRKKIAPAATTCGVTESSLSSSGQFYNCPNTKQTFENNAMKTANTPAPVASATGDKGLTATPSTRCLLPASALLEALTQAKTERATTGKANAYAVLLEQFHRAILPAFFIECGGNLSEISRLLGIHRETVRTYAALADIDMSGAAAVGGAVC